jgi:hypothetical protein
MWPLKLFSRRTAERHARALGEELELADRRTRVDDGRTVAAKRV